MKQDRHPLSILMADDDEDDRVLTKEAFAEAGFANDLRFVADGEELMEYLLHLGSYQDRALFPRPGLILLDLDMPRKDGRQALREIKSYPELRRIPIIVFTSSQAEGDIVLVYDLGANSFITKSVSFGELVNVVTALGNFWFEIVEFPGEQNER